MGIKTLEVNLFSKGGFDRYSLYAQSLQSAQLWSFGVQRKLTFTKVASRINTFSAVKIHAGIQKYTDFSDDFQRYDHRFSIQLVFTNRSYTGSI